MDDLGQKVVIAGLSIIGGWLLKDVFYDRWKAKRARRPRIHVKTERLTDSKGFHSINVSAYYEVGPDLYDAEPSFHFKVLPDSAISTEVRWLAMGRTLARKKAGLPFDRGNGLAHTVRYAWTENKNYNPSVPWKAGQTKNIGFLFDPLEPWEFLDAADAECAVFNIGNKHESWLRASIDEAVRGTYTQLIEERREMQLLVFDPHGPEPTIGEPELAQIAEVKAAFDSLFAGTHPVIRLTPDLSNSGPGEPERGG